ncbi:hypothetical protein LZZ85_06325 [Terrimonas sp. NA20]|uniref:Aromatic hydrocarbon degradation protein n=1 Tax=Terrimonas ginsenosidimutans TaxID=2908004 RepID=A0ABS9KNI1_9BACT|nr:hypothetical protein [Terrimonas ginsenosidimutans]MCG2613887.1 hypothetical protein [Terrimonas ginsenosidimutans]
MKYNKRSLAVSAGLFVILQVNAQNMNSPYSIYGIGDIDFKPYNRTSGMGGAGLALNSSYYLIDNNPAAIAGLQKSFYTIDAAFTGKSVRYSGGPINADNSDNKDFWIKRLAFAVKINNSWASGIGIGQFSNVNYVLTGTKPVDGTTGTYTTYYEGDGGLNEYYWNNAFKIGKRLTLGVKSSILSGSINQTETVSDAGLSTAVSTKVQDYMSKARFQFGAIYTQPLSKTWELSVGGKYIPTVNMRSDRSLTVTDGTSVILEDDFIKTDRFSLPDTYAGGIALRKRNKITYALDYSYEDWSSLGIKDNGWQLVNSSRIAGGIELSRQATTWNKQTIEKGFFQFGAFFNNSYLQVRNEPIREYGITAGIGGIIGGGLFYTMSLEAGSRGTRQQDLIKENYVQATFTFSYRDFLQSKGRRYD